MLRRMKVLTATAAGQGARDNDYNWTVEGELVLIGYACGTDRLDPDGGCGCGRAFTGLSSHRGGTTAVVRDLPLTRQDVATALVGHHESTGFGAPPAEELRAELDELLGLAEFFQVGALLERRLNEIAVRPT
jgi:hypothetical protein